MTLFSRIFGGGSPAMAERVAPTFDMKSTPAPTAPPAVAMGLGAGFSLAGASTPSSAGPVVTADTALRVTTIFRCIVLRSETVAGQPLELYRRKGDGREVEKKHRLRRIVRRKPNAWQTPSEFWGLLQTWKLQHGNAYAFIQRDGRGQVLALLPVHPSLVRVYRAFDGTPIYQFCLWPGTEQFTVTSDYMLHLRGPSLNGYLGMSPISVAAESVGDAIATQRFGSQFFANGAAVSGVLSLPGKLGGDAQRRVAAQWAAAYAGPANQHKTVVLGDGAKYERIGIPQKEAQWIELRGFQVEDLARIYGVPPFLLGATSKSTSWGTGLEQAVLGFIKFTLSGDFTAIAQACDRDLLLDFEDEELFFGHDTTQLERGDLKSFAEAMSKLFNTAAINPNEIRERLSLNPYEGGAQFRAPVNTAPNGGEPGDAAGASVEEIAAAVAEHLAPLLNQ